MSNEYKIATITLDTPPGAVLERMKQAACVAALQHRCDVTFVHNDLPFRVTFEALLGCVYEQEKPRVAVVKDAH